MIQRICGVMVSVLGSSAVDHGFGPRSGQTKDDNIGILLLDKAGNILILALNNNYSLTPCSTNIASDLIQPLC